MSALELYLVGDYDGAIEKSKQAAKDPGSLAHLAGFLAHMAKGKATRFPQVATPRLLRTWLMGSRYRAAAITLSVSL